MDNATRTQIVTAAVTAAGVPVTDPSFHANVKIAAASIVAMLGEKSEMTRFLDMMNEAKVFVGTVVKVTKEKSSTRGKIDLKTRVTERNESGIESVRTERTDSNEDGRLLAQRFHKQLLGHRVRVWVELQAIQNDTEGRKVRIVQHVEDLGVDPEFLSISPEGKAAAAAEATSAA